MPDSSDSIVYVKDVFGRAVNSSNEVCASALLRLPVVLTFSTSQLYQLPGEVEVRRIGQEISDGFVADTPEHARLDLQHNIIKLHMGLYAAPDAVRKALAPALDGETPTVLDIGECILSISIHFAAQALTGTGSGKVAGQIDRLDPHLHFRHMGYRYG